MTNLNLSVEEWRVVKYVDPKNTMKQIASASKLNDMEIRRIVYGLIQAGLVEMVRPSTAPLQLNPKMFPTKDKVEQRNLINKLIGRIQRL
jgi:DNA-binding IclR family transcriptional regulator